MMTYAQINDAWMSANQARVAIYDLADDFSWETVAREMVSRMSGDEAREFVESARDTYVLFGLARRKAAWTPSLPVWAPSAEVLAGAR